MSNQHKPEDALNLPARVNLALAKLRLKPNGKSAHGFRTNYRRLQVWLESTPTICLDKQEKQARKFLDKVLSAAGKLRDTELHLEMLDEAASGRDDRDKKKLSKALNKKYDKRRQRVQSLFRGPSLADASTLLDKLNLFPVPSTQISSDDDREQQLQSVLHDYAKFVECRPPLGEESLHQYRLTCKEYRYRAELLAGKEVAEAALKLFKQIQDAIGEWHDWQLLLELSEKLTKKGQLSVRIQKIRDSKLVAALDRVARNELKLLEQSGERERKPVQRVTSVAGSRIAV